MVVLVGGGLVRLGWLREELKIWYYMPLRA